MPTKSSLVEFAVGTALVLLAAPTFMFGQEVASEKFEGEIEVVEVLLDVLVTDKDDRVILGLRKEDFQVAEDGSPVELNGVTFYSSRELLGSSELAGGPSFDIDTSPVERYFIVFFQQQQRTAVDSPGVLSQQLRAAKECQEWVRLDLQANDYVAVVSYQTRLDVIQDFSTDVESTVKAISLAATGGRSSDEWPSRRDPIPVDGPSLLRTMPRGKDLGRQTTDIYTALQVLSKAAGETAGRKNLLFFGRGFGQIGDNGLWQPDSRYYKPTVETLNDNNVAVYPLDLVPRGVRHTLEQSLSAVAIETGGQFYRYFSSFLVPLQEINLLNTGYYLLSYSNHRPTASSGFQKVRVSTRTKGLKVTARRGYLYGEDTSGKDDS